MNNAIKFKRLAIILAVIAMVLSTAVMFGAVKVRAAGVTTQSGTVAAGEETEMESAEAGTATVETMNYNDEAGTRAMAAAIAVGVAAAVGAFSMGMAISKSNESVARQPEAAGKIQTQLMLGLVFIETAIIYALIVAILIIFVM